jgi:hypothetical protein
MVREFAMLLFSVYMILLVIVADIIEGLKRDGRHKVVIVPRGRGYWRTERKRHTDAVLVLFVIWIGTIFVAWDPSISLWFLLVPTIAAPLLVWSVRE